jgi:hypothetical protein
MRITVALIGLRNRVRLKSVRDRSCPIAQGRPEHASTRLEGTRTSRPSITPVFPNYMYLPLRGTTKITATTCCRNHLTISSRPSQPLRAHLEKAQLSEQNNWFGLFDVNRHTPTAKPEGRQRQIWKVKLMPIGLPLLVYKKPLQDLGCLWQSWRMGSRLTWRVAAGWKS